MTAVTPLQKMNAFDVHPDIKRTLLRQNANPFDCARELVANGFDADAGTVWVDIDLIDHDLFRLQVIDNGKGMTEQDLINFAFTMFASSADGSDRPSGVGQFGIGLFSTFAVPDMQKLVIITRSVRSTHGLLLAAVNPETLQYRIEQVDDSVREKYVRYPMKLDKEEPMDVILQVPPTPSGTAVSVLFRSSRLIDELRKEILIVLQYHFRFLSRTRKLYTVEHVISKKTGKKVLLPVRINAFRPNHLVRKSLLTMEIDRTNVKDAIPFIASIDCELTEESDSRGLYILTGEGVVLARYTKYHFIDTVKDVPLFLDHCTVWVKLAAKGSLEYSISRNGVHDLSSTRSLMTRVFWEVIVKFALDFLHVTSPRFINSLMLPTESWDFLHFIQTVIAYLKSCEKTAVGLYVGRPAQEKLIHDVLYKRQVFPLYSGDYYPWASLVEEYAQRGRLRYFNDRSLLEELQHQRLDSQVLGDVEFIVHTVGNPNLLTYYKYCFNMDEVSSEYRFDTIGADDEWMCKAFNDMIECGKHDPSGLVVTPVAFRQWTGNKLSWPLMHKDTKKNLCLVNINAPIIQKIAAMAHNGDPYRAGHLFEKLFVENVYHADKRRERLTSDAVERLSNMEVVH